LRCGAAFFWCLCSRNPTKTPGAAAVGDWCGAVIMQENIHKDPVKSVASEQRSSADGSTSWVYLNVGGVVFATTKQTLCMEENTSTISQDFYFIFRTARQISFFSLPYVQSFFCFAIYLERIIPPLILSHFEHYLFAFPLGFQRGSKVPQCWRNLLRADGPQPKMHRERISSIATLDTSVLSSIICAPISLF
jgi:hypothetical protein